MSWGLSRRAVPGDAKVLDGETRREAHIWTPARPDERLLHRHWGTIRDAALTWRQSMERPDRDKAETWERQWRDLTETKQRPERDNLETWQKCYRGAPQSTDSVDRESAKKLEALKRGTVWRNSVMDRICCEKVNSLHSESLYTEPLYWMHSAKLAGIWWKGLIDRLLD